MVDIKSFYEGHSDQILKKRLFSVYPIRRYAHESQYEAILQHVGEGTVLDAGCGEGAIGLLLAKKKIASTGIDLSYPNIEKAQQQAQELGVADYASYTQGDAEKLPFPDASFDTVISSHVLEHLPSFDAGWQELCRVARKRIIVALPTGFNLCALALLGGDHGYWRVSKRSLWAIPWGILRTCVNLFGEGVQEGYAGKDELPHIWRFPWIVRRRLSHPDWKIVSYEASSLSLPYVNALIPVVRWLDRFRSLPFLRYLGYGSTIVLERK
jgi:SAM-dependent methyltransferase